MASSYFTLPSFSRGQKDKTAAGDKPQTDSKPDNPEPVLKDEDEKFLEQHLEDKDGAGVSHEATATQISDDGGEKEIPAPASADQVVVPEEQHEPVQTKPKSKGKGIELPSQEEAEAATRGFTASSAPATAQPDSSSEKRTWVSFLTSLAPTTKKPESADPSQDPATTTKKPEPANSSQDAARSSSQQSWTQYVNSYVPSLPSSWRGSGSGTSSGRSSSPVLREDGSVDEEATKAKQEHEVSALLDQLNLSTINNRLFAFGGDDLQAVYSQFGQVLKDIINGAPTAYDDLDALMRSAGPRLEQRFAALPPFVQTLVKSLPMKLGPELAAVAAEKPGDNMKASLQTASQPGASSVADTATEDKEKDKKKSRKVPGLKSLVSREGAVAGMLRNVVSFLQTRFPFLASTTNVVMSLAVFILMFVFWYCHKRGKEVRLAKEAGGADGAEDAAGDSNEEVSEEDEEDQEDEEGAGKTDDAPHETPEDILSQLKAPESDKQAALNQPAPAEVPLPADSEKA